MRRGATLSLMSSTDPTLQPVDDITDYNLHNVWFLWGETHTGVEILGDSFSGEFLYFITP